MVPSGTYPATGDPTGGRLVAWAAAASAAHQLATALVKTAIIPDVYRGRPGDAESMRTAADNAAAAILLGDEIGLSPIAALRSVYVIKGQPAMYTRTMVALVLGRGHRMWTEHESDESVTVAGHRVGDPEHVERSTWSLARARAEGFANRNTNYRDHPRAMLYARAAADVARRVAPDVLLGVPETPAEELGGAAAVDVANDPGGARVVRRAGGTGPARLTDAAPALSVVPGAGGAPTPPPGSSEVEPIDLGAAPEVPDAPQTSEPATTGTPAPDEPESPADGDEDTEPVLQDDERLITSPQRALMHAGFKALGLDRDGPTGYIAVATRIVGHPIDSTSDLTVAEASLIIDAIEDRRRRLTPPPDEPEVDPPGADAYRGPR
jgi:hypothetical protein